MRTLRLVLGDQLSDTLSSLRDIDAAKDVVLMAEVMAEAEYVRHHKQKLVMVFAAMRASPIGCGRAGSRFAMCGWTIRPIPTRWTARCGAPSPGRTSTASC